MEPHAIITSATPNKGRWQVSARSVVAGRTVSFHTFTDGPVGVDDHAGAARSLALSEDLDGVWHCARLGEGYVFVCTSGPNGDFALGKGFEQYDPPDAPWSEEAEAMTSSDVF